MGKEGDLSRGHSYYLIPTMPELDRFGFPTQLTNGVSGLASLHILLAYTA